MRSRCRSCASSRPTSPASNSTSRSTSRTTWPRQCRASKARIPSSCSATICRRCPTPPTRSRPCWPRCLALPISRSSPRSASLRSRSRSIARGRRATVLLRGTSMPRSERPSAANRPVIFTSRAATGTSPSWYGSRRPLNRNPEAIQNLRIGVQGPNGTTQIPLNEVANVKLVSGPSYIYREGQERYLPIKFSVRDRDLGSAIEEAQRKIAQQVQLPAGSRIEWVGEFRNLQDAIGRLKVVVPITLALIALLLWINFGSMTDTLLAMSVIPMAVVGGIFALFLMHIPFSVSAAIGFIALFGISVMDGIIILSQFNQL